MPGVSEEQIARVREINLPSYLQAYEPGEPKPGEYEVDENGVRKTK